MIIANAEPDCQKTAVLAGSDLDCGPKLTNWLEESGYRVRKISDRFHALVAIESDPQIELLITDKRSDRGRTLARAAHEIRDSVSVLYLESNSEAPEREAQALMAQILYSRSAASARKIA